MPRRLMSEPRICQTVPDKDRRIGATAVIYLRVQARAPNRRFVAQKRYSTSSEVACACARYAPAFTGRRGLPEILRVASVGVRVRRGALAAGRLLKTRASPSLTRTVGLMPVLVGERELDARTNSDAPSAPPSCAPPDEVHVRVGAVGHRALVEQPAAQVKRSGSTA